jgi:phasin family protein
MYPAQEQFAALNKANLEAATRFASVALGGAERLFEIQMKTAKEVLAESVESVKTLSSVKDLQQLAEVKDSVTQPAFEKAADYVKSVYEIAAETQAEMGKLIELQVAGFNKQFVVALDKMAESAPAGSEAGISALKTAIATGNAAYENLSKAAKQFGETAKSNLEAAAKRATVPAVKKTKK